MSVPPLGDYNVTETVHIPFNTFDSNDPSESVTIGEFALGDIKIYKDGSDTERNQTGGITVDDDFDGKTGAQMVHIDLSNNDDADFYEAGSRYMVLMEGVSVDSGELNAWIGTFTIGITANAEKMLAYFQLLSRKDSDIATDRATELTELNNDEGSGGGAYDNETDSQEATRDAIVDSNPQSHSATANSIPPADGTIVSGGYANTFTADASYFQLSPDGGGLEEDMDFNIGTGRVPDQLIITAYFDNNGSPKTRTVQVWAYDYNLAEYIQLSNSTNDFGDASAVETFQYSMTNNMRDASSGDVSILVTSTSTDTGDVFYWDLARVTSVAQEAAGLTADTIQATVWARADSGHDHDTLGHALASTYIVDALVVAVTSTSQFTINTGIANNDAFNGSPVQITDETDGHHETRRIVDYIGGTKEVFLDRALSFTPEADDVVHIMGTYADVNVTHVGGTAQTALDINDILDDTDELQTDDIPGTLATISGYVDALETRLTATRAGYLDELGPTNLPADIDTLLTRLSSVRAAVLTDWINGGRLDAILDIIAVDTTTDIPGTITAIAALIATAQADLDKLTGSDGATLATAQGNYAPAKAGDLMGLANDAITAAKYDESTAFPLAKADSGDDEVARTGADSDTLKDLSDEIAAVSTTGDATQTKQDTIITVLGTPSASIADDIAAISITGDATAANQAAIAALLAAIQGTGFVGATDSLEAIRNRGDAAWITGTGGVGGGGDASAANQTLIIDAITVMDALIDVIKTVTDNLPNSGALTTLIAHLTDIKGATWTGSTDSLEAIRNRGDAAWITGFGAGTGETEWEYPVTYGGNPLADVYVWVTSDEDGETTVASDVTNSEGIATFWLDDGVTYYFWSVKDGYNFDNPDEETVSA